MLKYIDVCYFLNILWVRLALQNLDIKEWGDKVDQKEES